MSHRAGTLLGALGVLLLLVGCKPKEPPVLTEYQYHWINGCDAALWKFPGADTDARLARGKVLHDLGCENVPPELIKQFHAERLKATEQLKQ